MGITLPDPAACDTLRQRLAAHQQDHLLQFWDQLDAVERSALQRQIEAIDWQLMKGLYESAGKCPVAGEVRSDQLDAPSVLSEAVSFDDWERDQRAAEAGERVLRDGQVAVLLVAGGQGSRLGHDGPKGTYPIGPVTGRTLFQIHAEKVLALSRRYERPLPLLIMTSPENDAATRAFFTDHRYFGLATEQVECFTQGTLPAVDAATGKALLAAPGQLAVSPNGHGGVVEALARSGHLERLQEQGIRYLFYFQVDNPLVRIADPTFLGHHVLAGAEMSLKVVDKLNPAEKLGAVVSRVGRLEIIEYSDLPMELANARDADGRLRLWAGSIAIHVFDVAFLQRLARESSLPYHCARKVVPYLDASGQVVQPTEPNAIKYERFVFDALPLAREAVIVETNRREEFEPLKNADGENSPATVRQALSNLYADWLRRAGVEVARTAKGDAAVPIEISPLFALDGEELRDKVGEREPVTEPLVLTP